MRRETKSYPIAGLKAIDTDTGVFEAVVSVFGNVDLHGHRIASDAFDASLDRWRASGDPIPVIFSHQWDDLSSYLGTIDPNKVRALPPGDPDLPEAVAEWGGLFVEGQLDTTEPEGRKAAKLLKSRAVREFSFAYDVLDEAKADDGFLDLLELDLIEAGPTLKGANPLTQLVGAKSTAGGLEVVAEVFDLDAKTVAEVVATVEALAPDPPPAPAAKAFVTLSGTLERVQEALTREAQTWAADTYGDNYYWAYIEGTYTDRVVFYVELWDDPVGGGRYFEAAYTVDGDDLTFDEPTPVTIEATVTVKDRGTKTGRRSAAADFTRIQDIHNLTHALGAECAAEELEEEGDPKAVAPAVLRTSLDVELLELG